MQQTVSPVKRIRATITPPGDKSISHRAAMFNAISSGTARVEGFLPSADCLATLRCLRALGVEWRLDGETLEIEGRGLEGLTEPNSVLDCKNSGTSMRLFSGLLSPQPFQSILTGDASLRSRPMSRVIEPLRKMGADISGREKNTRAPLAIRGRGLKGIRYTMPVASAQVKSAVILASLFAEGQTQVEEPVPTRDHTERMLKTMGADVRFGEGPVVLVSPQKSPLKPLPLRVPGDISSVAPWLVLGAVHPDAEIRISGVCVNPTRTGIIDALTMMGADIILQEERTWGAEPVADLVVRSSRLQGCQIGGAIIPRLIDEVPLLALAACFAEGSTEIRDASELRVKESDRVSTTAAGLRRLGARIEEKPDGMAVKGVHRLAGTSVSSYGDHRLAVMLGVAGLLATGETVVRNSSVVGVSYPRFWQDLGGISEARRP
jgi:3-phosphoshikimate 1-carboxyvinyltransferase